MPGAQGPRKEPAEMALRRPDGGGFRGAGGVLAGAPACYIGPMRFLRAFFPLFLLGGLGCSSSSAGVTSDDSGAADTFGDAPANEAGGTQCTSARDTAVGPVDKVSSGAVTVLSDTGGVKTLYIDASAGGVNGGKTNPWIYVKLATPARADLTDRQSFTSADWDLAFKRASIHTNSGDAGPGGGGARLTTKAFDTVTIADAINVKPETWFDAECTLATDPIGGIKTTFDGWYDYDSATMKVTPRPGTVIVRAANGDLFKLEITDYYGTPTGGTGTAGGNYLVKLAALK